jgi:hypothetical protein
MLFENISGAAGVGDVPGELKTPPRILETSSRSERRTRQVKMACNTRSSLEETAGIGVEPKVNVVDSVGDIRVQ